MIFITLTNNKKVSESKNCWIKKLWNNILSSFSVVNITINLIIFDFITSILWSVENVDI